ncbi:TetR/AcrR family transcriptional regulator [Pseudonocardia humida]|uniref:TetR/AcrR family transcriptional regulator n=1 Tax=Pseudonocardia humida TaxID=2800819 RepID=A0ABT1A8E4_9PSEU|nr:TetR/AcrR family transcriptional regulator [Pseudonocardia humida]MCO1658969.1 TetR/AcrR family transcriptional regulator [Pseudonocardia humida]
MADRPLRADARRNRERVLEAARELFAASGIAVPLDEIAARAGVGPGTVYRHFPTKEALFEAVTTARLHDLVEFARARAAADDPAAAFDEFLDRLTEEAAAKRDLPEAFTAVGMDGLAPAREELFAVLTVLVRRAQEVGAVRAEIRASDLLALLKGMLQAAGESPDPTVLDRIAVVLRDGLRPPAPQRINLSTDTPGGRAP